VPREERDALLVVAAGARVLAVPALDAVAEGLGPAGAGLVVRIRP
jgi:tRNA(Ile)-lysidine synthase